MNFSDQDLQRLKSLEHTASALSPDAETFDSWLKSLQSYSQNFLQSINHQPAFTKAQIEKSGSELEKPPVSLDDALSTFEAWIQDGINTASGKFMGYIPGGGVPTAAIADYLAALTNRYSGFGFASPGAVRIENEVTQWMCSSFDLPETAWGTLTSGGSTANLLAILAARETILQKDWSDSVVYMSAQSHHTIRKALKVAGLAHIHTRVIETDVAFRMNTDLLAKSIQADLTKGLKPWMVVANAGSTNTGSIDSLPAVAEITKRHSLWLHIDAAYGGFFYLTECGKSLLSGLNLADSITLDPHKALFMPYGCGAVLVRNGEILKAAVSEDSEYLADAKQNTQRSPADYSIELTRHFRALRIWLSFRLLGVTPFIEALEEKLLLARYAFERLQALPNLEPATAPELSTVVFRVSDDTSQSEELTKALLQRLFDRENVCLSSTSLNDKTYIRISILNFRTHLKEVDECLSEIRLCLEELTKNSSKTEVVS